MLKSTGTLLDTRPISKLVLGNHLMLEERALIPVVEVYASILPKLHAGWMAAFPKAIVVVDGDSETALPLTDEPVSLTQLLDDLPDLATHIDRVRDQIPP